jgi:phosphoglycolate phosphatase-like HAD superfamily hydrolase
VQPRLVLWDVDFTLVDAGGQSRDLYRLVFRELFGRELDDVAPMAGRTDRAIILDTLGRAGVPDPAGHVRAFVARLAAHAPEFAARVRAHGHALPGAADALRALSALGLPRAAEPTPPHATSARVVQSALTGNVRSLAEAKLTALGLAGYLDLDVGAYGEAHTDRAELVSLARDNAARAHRLSFPGQRTVLVGDTQLDVAAAVATGARAVAVATGSTTAGELAAAGADVVLPDLTDTAAVVAAILGIPRSAANP